MIADSDLPNQTQALPPLEVPAPAPATSTATQVFRPARLIPQNAEAGRQNCPLTLKPLSIGAASGNDVRLGGPGVEPRHAQISATMTGFPIVDLNTKHGTRVNAEKIRERPQRNDDVIQIGAARFVFREG